MTHSDKIQNIDLSRPETIEEAVFHIPGFLKTFSNFIKHTSSIEDFYLQKLEKIIGTIFQIFPRIWPHRQELLKPELGRLFASCFFCSVELLKRLLEAITTQGLMCTFGIEIQSKYFLEDKNHLWDYLKLWKYFLNIQWTQFPEFLELKDNQEKLISLIYDEFLNSVIKIFTKLDLRYSVETLPTSETVLVFKNEKGKRDSPISRFMTNFCLISKNRSLHIL